ncbi:Ankyrin repeat-containing protein [Artemisia annua]|uniref:Ankyrin repeat-containing protein n=1 Tax=Artemisia annua TaxID=35608 RepID=A0A2U1L6R3_ARTAN|nr:Ankyrin repeat-containing protein [Artemisia annua]
MAAGSSINWDAVAATLDGRYNQALNANVSNFVMVKLSGHDNYEIWHAQMMCLLDVYNMRWFLQDHAWYSLRSPEIAKIYHNLLKGWVISSIDQHVLKSIQDSFYPKKSIQDASSLFHKLKCKYGPHTTDHLEGSTSPERLSKTDDRMLMDVLPNDSESTEYMMELLNATMEGSWWKAKAILKNHKDAATKAISKNGDTILHLAVREGKNYFVKQLLNFIKDGSEIKIRNVNGHTALHTAAIADNKQAAELLVNKNNKLLYMSMTDVKVVIPLEIAQIYSYANTFLYLLEVTPYGQELRKSFDSGDDFHSFLINATGRKQYNLALKLLEIPELLASAAEDDKALWTLAINFPPELGFWEALIYPYMIFTREHADLLKEGEQWMKTTAESCSITAALIVTIVFAAAITVPGGSNQEMGIPLFKKKIAFTIFAVCDALSLFTAATALLVFLSILTTRFAEKDFLVSLPRRLILGLCALFISTTAMMVAFGAILFLDFCDQRPWMLAPIGLFACMPIFVIVTLQLPLVLDLYQSTYISRFDKKKFH